MDIIICLRWISRHLERECYGRIRDRRNRIQVSRGGLAEIKKKFGGGDKESVKAVELKKIEQGERIMEEFVQDFKRVAGGSGYKGCPLIEEFKQCINRSIRRKLMEAENQPDSIEQ